MTDHVLYRHFTAGGELLYVGITLDPAQRWRGHRATKSWWTSIATTIYQHFDSRDALVQAERQAIVDENPIWNTVRYQSSRHLSDDLTDLYVDDFGQLPHNFPPPTDRGLLSWLRPQAWPARDDKIGDLARDLADDPDLRRKHLSAHQLWLYFDQAGAAESCYDCLCAAAVEYLEVAA